MRCSRRAPEARRDPDGRRDAGRSGLEVLPRCCRSTRRPRSSCSRCKTIRATSARRSRQAPAATCSRRRPTPRSSPPSARSRVAAATSIPSSERGCRGRRAAARAGRRGSALRARARGAAPARTRAHEPGDREAALHLGAHGRDAPGAHHAEARLCEPRGARALRDRAGPAREPENGEGRLAAALSGVAVPAIRPATAFALARCFASRRRVPSPGS